MDSSRQNNNNSNNSGGSSPDNREQYIWIVRYGLTQYPLVEFEGPFDSDISSEGVQHAKCIAKRIQQNGMAVPKVIFSSPFLRTAHTSQIIADELTNTDVCIEEGLYEWLIPSLLVEPDGKRTYPKDVKSLAEQFPAIDVTYKSVNPLIPDDAGDIPEGSPHFEESEEDLVKRCAKTLDKLLEQSSSRDNPNFLIVSHAPVDIGICVCLEGTSLEEFKRGPLALGGVSLFSRQLGSSEFKCHLYGDTQHMPGQYAKGIKKWGLPSMGNSL